MASGFGSFTPLTNPAVTTATTGFSFGTAPSATGATTFNAPALGASTTTAASSGFSLPGAKPTGFSMLGSSFGKPNTTAAATTTTATQGFGTGLFSNMTSTAPAQGTATTTTTTTTTGFSLGAPATTASTGFSFGTPASSAAGTALAAAAITTTTTTTSTGFSWGLSSSTAGAGTTATTTTATTGFSLGAGTTTAWKGFSLGVTATTTTTTAGSSLLATPATTAAATTATASPTVKGTAVAATTTTTPSQVKFSQLEDNINKWTIELEEQEKVFMNQVAHINEWDRLLLSNGDKIVSLNKSVEKVKLEQQQLDHDLDFIVAQQRELEECLLPLEKEFADISVPDPERDATYRLAENLNTQLRHMSEDLKEIIEDINERNKNQDTTDPIVQIGRILNAHMNSLQWVDQNTTLIKQELDQLTKLTEIHKRENDSTQNL